MSWIPAFDRVWAWALLAAIPVGILLLYFLKLRREPVEIPSTFLWARTIEDLHVNSLIQRLRRNLLLLLQLLAILLAAIALLRPGIRGESSQQDRQIYLLDTSASMQAVDDEDGESRFERARLRIEEQIEGMTDEDTAMLVTFNNRAQVLQSFTSDRRRLREALARARVTNRGTDILGALQAADGLANPPRTSQAGDLNDVQVADAQPAALELFSDGGFQPVTEFNLGNLVPQYNAVGTDDVKNLAITAFSAERNVEQPTEVEAFATVANLGSSPATATASLLIDGALVEAASIDLQPGEETGLPFAIESDSAVTLEMMLDQDDDLLLDNHAYTGLTPMRMVSVLVVTPGNKPLEVGLATERAQKVCVAEFVTPGYLESEAYAKRAEGGVDDLIIYDRCAPQAMPNTNTFSIGTLPNGDWSWASDPGSLIVIDVDRLHPLTRYVELFSLLIFEGRALAGPEGATELVGSDAGPILSLASREGHQDLVLGFELVSKDEAGATQVNTNWYAERSWPVFLLNVLRHLAGAAEASGAPSYPPGETIRVRVESAIAEVTVRRVGGASRNVTVGPGGFLEWTDTETPGNYVIEAGDRMIDLFSINLFDPRESRLATKPEVEIGYEEVEAATGVVEKRREYWRWLLVGMLGLLSIEWWYFSRRLA